MGKLKVDELDPGMVLAADVDDHNGYRILAKGTVLTQKQLELLLTWEVFEVVVEEKKAEEPVQEAAKQAEDEALEAARRRLEKLFEGRLVNEWMEALYREAQKRLPVPRYWKTQI